VDSLVSPAWGMVKFLARLAVLRGNGVCGWFFLALQPPCARSVCGAYLGGSNQVRKRLI